MLDRETLKQLAVIILFFQQLVQQLAAAVVEQAQAHLVVLAVVVDKQEVLLEAEHLVKEIQVELDIAMALLLGLAAVAVGLVQRVLLLAQIVLAVLPVLVYQIQFPALLFIIRVAAAEVAVL